MSKKIVFGCTLQLDIIRLMDGAVSRGSSGGDLTPNDPRGTAPNLMNPNFKESYCNDDKLLKMNKKYILCSLNFRLRRINGWSCTSGIVWCTPSTKRSPTYSFKFDVYDPLATIRLRWHIMVHQKHRL